MITILRQRNFGLLFAGHLVSQVGDMVLFIALPFWIYRLTGSAAATGAMFVALTLPQLFLSPIAGVFVDRWDRKATMIVADLLRAGIVLGMLTVQHRDQVWIIYVLAFAESSVSRFFLPARTAVLPQLVQRDDLPRANAALGVSDALTQLGGPALGGVLVAVWGTRGAITVDAVSYLASAAIISMLRIPSIERGRAAASSGLDAVAAVAREMVEGVQVVMRRPELRAVMTLQTLFMLSQGIVNALLVVMVSHIWGGGSTELGWLVSAQGIGALAGGALLGGVAGRFRPRTLMVVGGVGCGVLVLLVVNQPSFTLALPMIAAVGTMAVIMLIGEQTMTQLGSDDHNRGRVASLVTTVSAAASLTAMAVTTALADRVGVVAMLDVAALLMVLAGLSAVLAPAGVAVRAANVPAEQAA